jgi:hypothetical protein
MGGKPLPDLGLDSGGGFGPGYIPPPNARPGSPNESDAEYDARVKAEQIRYQKTIQANKDKEFIMQTGGATDEARLIRFTQLIGDQEKWKTLPIETQAAIEAKVRVLTNRRAQEDTKKDKPKDKPVTEVQVAKFLDYQSGIQDIKSAISTAKSRRQTQLNNPKLTQAQKDTIRKAPIKVKIGGKMLSLEEAGFEIRNIEKKVKALTDLNPSLKNYLKKSGENVGNKTNPQDDALRYIP